MDAQRLSRPGSAGGARYSARTWKLRLSSRKMLSLLIPLAFALTLFGHVAAASAAGQGVQNDVFWKDTSGNPIYSQGGGVLKVGDTYYWYGAKYNGAVSYYNNPAGGPSSDSSFSAITCYSSTDLAHWTFCGNALTSSDLGGAFWVGRIGVAHNPNTGKYVLIAQYNSELVFATSSTPNGHFSRAATQSTIANVSTGMSGDQSLFVDDNGQAYLAFSNKSGRSHLYVAELRPSDFLQVEPAANIYNSPVGREGNIMFKHAGTYYFCSSDLHGWNASPTYCIQSSHVSSGYSAEYVMQGSSSDFSHVTQSGLAFAVNGSSGSFVMFGGDRWSDLAGNGIGYNEWDPVTFNGTTPTFHSLSQWNVDAAAGTWSVGSGNNYVLNPSFEADRVSQSALAGWTNSGSGNSNHLGGHTGRWAMQQSSSSAYSAAMYQNISVPNGTYTLSVWVKSSGGQNAAKIFAKNFGGSEMDQSINHAIGSWTHVSIPGINVTNGAIQVGVSSNANAGNWVDADDFTLVQTGSGGGGGSDTTPPSVPTGLTVSGVTSSSVSLAWSASTDNVGVAGYDVLRNGALVGTSSGTSFTDSGLSSSTAYSYSLKAFDAAGNVSAASTPVSATTAASGGGGTYVRIRNVRTGLYIDGAGATTNGSNAVQYSSSTSDNQQWSIVADGSYVRIQNRATGLYLDGEGRTTNGSAVGQWASSTSNNQQWSEVADGANVRFENRATGLYIDGMNSTTNGADLGQWASSTSTDQQWTVVAAG